MIQAVELIRQTASAGGQFGIAIQCAVDAAIISEVNQRCAIRSQEIHGVLTRMDFGDGAASVRVRQIQEGVIPRSVAGGECIGDGALVNIDCAGINIGGGAVWNRGEC